MESPPIVTPTETKPCKTKKHWKSSLITR